IVILTNNDNQNFFEALRYQVLEAYLGVPFVDRGKALFGLFSQGVKQTEKDISTMNEMAGRKVATTIPMEDFTGEYQNRVYGKISISKSGDRLICRFEHHPGLVGYMDHMENNEFRITYSHIGYGIYPARFTISGGRAVAIVLRVNESLESDPYTFTR
ncbi:MAG: DUF3471 domain-containing protein, partial [Chitinophagaceae bacterium]|nr:DUF3471 domain-containing protein [Chitinophagaceae bacterium]